MPDDYHLWYSLDMAVSRDSETPAEGLQVFVACGFIHQKFDGVEKLFLPRRAKTKKFMPDVFELPGGHVDFGEDMVAGLKREILEEFKVNIEVGDPFYAFTYRNEIKGSHSIEVGYFAHFTSPLEDIKLDPEDHSEMRWATEDEISEILTDSENQEVKAIKRGFALLRGESLVF
jgi:8-oxo-dGTP pyrophosphatase MutT (NUDIX family)